MTTRKNKKSNKTNKRFRKTRSKRQKGETPPSPSIEYMIDAIEQDEEEQVKHLLEMGADVNATEPSNGNTPLIWASINRHTEIVAILLEKGADVNATDDNGDTALMKVINCNEEDDRPWYQVEYDITEIMEMLLVAGADVNVENKNGMTALDIAEKTGCTKQIKKLIIKHNIASTIPKGLERQEDRKNLAMVMSEKDVGNRGDGRMPYDLQHKIGEYLGGGKRRTRRLKKSKRKTRKTRSKRQRGGNEQMETQINTVGLDNALLSAIEVAPAEESDYEDVKYLIEKGANVNITGDEDHNVGKTPLMLITEDAEDEEPIDNFPAYKIVKLLLKHGADITAKDGDGYTAVYLTSSDEIRKLLIDKLLRQNDYYYKYPPGMINELKLQKIDPEIYKNLVKEIRDKITIEKEREKDRGNLAVIQEATRRGNTDASWKEKDVMGLLTEGQAPYAKNIKSFLGGKRKTKRKTRKNKRKTRKSRK